MFSTEQTGFITSFGAAGLLTHRAFKGFFEGGGSGDPPPFSFETSSSNPSRPAPMKNPVKIRPEMQVRKRGSRAIPGESRRK
jgi:hypothetical protein